MLSGLHLDMNSDVPLYRQLYQRIGEMVRSGVLLRGDKLPATRELAGRLGLNRTTVSAAYELLEADGLIQGHVGRGSFVFYEKAEDEPAADEALISFDSSRPAADQFPLSEFQACCREVAHGSDALAILQLGSPAGFPGLRRYLLERGRDEGCARDDDDVVITNGCQQALDLIARVLAPAGTTVIVEDPVYHGLKNVFARSGARLIGIAAGNDGIDVEQLARAVATEKPKLVVVTPNFQNPTGGTMPLEARRRLVELAQDSGLTIIENDLYGELRYEGENLPTLKQLDSSGRGILIRSFSKIAFPGLRVGWVTGPARVVSELASARQWCDLHTDQLSQAILWRFMASGRLAAHLDRVRAAGLERLRTVLGACERHLPSGTEFTRPQGGMNIWVRLPEGADANAALPKAERQGVTYLPGSHFAVANPAPNALRLSFGALSPERIEKGIGILGRVFREELETSSSLGRIDAAPALV